MGSRYHPKLYDPETAAALKRAFYDIWDKIEGQDTLRSGPSEYDVKVAIAQKLLDVVNEGTTSREAITREVLSRLGVEA